MLCVLSLLCLCVRVCVCVCRLVLFQQGPGRAILLGSENSCFEEHVENHENFDNAACVRAGIRACVFLNTPTGNIFYRCFRDPASPEASERRIGAAADSYRQSNAHLQVRGCCPDAGVLL